MAWKRITRNKVSWTATVYLNVFKFKRKLFTEVGHGAWYSWSAARACAQTDLWMYSHVPIYTHVLSLMRDSYPSQHCNEHCRAVLVLPLYNWEVLKSNAGAIPYKKPWPLPPAVQSQSSCHSITYDIHTSKSIINNKLRNNETDMSIMNRSS
jgi:hypothetical protein